jgi:hypothetical protein
MASKILKEVLERVETWPVGRQERAAKMLIEMEQQDAASISLTNAQVTEVERRLAKPNQYFVSLEEARKRLAVRSA